MPIIKVDISDFEKPILSGEVKLDERYLDVGLVQLIILRLKNIKYIVVIKKIMILMKWVF